MKGEVRRAAQDMFVVATSPTAGKTQALGLITIWTDVHRDDLYDADGSTRSIG